MEENRDLQDRREQYKKERLESGSRPKKKALMWIAGIAIFVLAVAGLIVAITALKNNGENINKEESVVLSAYPEESVPVSAVQEEADPDVSSAEIDQPANSSTVETTSDPAQDGILHIVAVGDNVMHEKVYMSADTSKEVWNYDKLYEHIQKDIQPADLASVNEECVLVADHKNVSGYPTFGAPTEAGDALINAGFNVVTMATNHVYDKGKKGILQSLEYWEDAHPETIVLGIHKDQEAAREIRTAEVEGITIAMLDYTCLINGGMQNKIPTGMVDYANEVKMRADVRQARSMADLVIVYLHAGTEYADQPDKQQKELLKMLLEEGADITICSHPHVLQGFETLQNDEGKQMLVYYSLGNFISSQKDPKCLLGGMADIKITRDEQTGSLKILDSQLIPLVTHYNYEENIYTVYRLDEYTEELAASHSVHEESDEEFTLSSLKAMAENAINASYSID